MYEWHAEDLHHYVQKKFNQKYQPKTYEWVRHLLSFEISTGGQGEQLISNYYDDLVKLTKKKPDFRVNPWDWTPKVNVSEIQITTFPGRTCLLFFLFIMLDPLDEASPDDDEEDEKKEKKTIKIQADENGFPSVPWPEQKLDTMGTDELIEYIRVCKRALKQGAALYADLLKSDEEEPENDEIEEEDEEDA